MVDMNEKTPSHKGLDKRMTINVGGVRHETLLSTLEKIPGTRLALLAHLQVGKIHKNIFRVNCFTPLAEILDPAGSQEVMDHTHE